jgi:NADH-quinone oxidoreductase subunit H
MCFLSLLLPIFLLNSSFNLLEIILNQKSISNYIIFFPNFLYFFIVILAETNRIPFDLPEAEAELVAGYNVEYSSINFAMFFLAEYTNMLINSYLIVFFFFGFESFKNYSLIINYFIFLEKSYNLFLNIKVVIISLFFIIVRSLLPRYRFDQLMNLC